MNLLIQYEDLVKKNDGFNLYEWYIDDFQKDLRCVNAKEGTYLDGSESMMVLKSDDYGFIRWLVESDKVNLLKVKEKFRDRIHYIEYGEGDFACDDYEILVIVLSIDDNPEVFLLTVLK